MKYAVLETNQLALHPVLLYMLYMSFTTLWQGLVQRQESGPPGYVWDPPKACTWLDIWF